MAYEIVPDSILQLSFEGRVYSQQIMTVLSYRLISETPIPDGAASADAFLSNAIAAGGIYRLWLDCLSQNAIDCDAYAQWITPTRYAYRAAGAGNTVGTMGFDCISPNYSAGITRRGELANRHSISNLHMPAVPDTGVQQGLLMPVYEAPLEIFKEKSLEGFTLGFGAELLPVAFNRSAPSTSIVLVEGFVQNTARVMRRRTVGVGS